MKDGAWISSGITDWLENVVEGLMSIDISLEVIDGIHEHHVCSKAQHHADVSSWQEELRGNANRRSFPSDIFSASGSPLPHGDSIALLHTRA